jgi:hypothetical protein
MELGTMIDRIHHFGNPDQNTKVTCHPGHQDRPSPSGLALQADRVSLSKASSSQPAGIKSEQDLNEDEKKQVNKLKKRDLEVKAHEQAHMAAGGGIVQGGATYQYINGPDGKQYAVGGEVKIDLSKENTSDATIRKMQQVRRAALAPAQPSGTDRSVAAQASQIEAQARMERTQEKKEAIEENQQSNTIDPLRAANSDRPISPQGPRHQATHLESYRARGNQVDLMA